MSILLFAHEPLKLHEVLTLRKELTLPQRVTHLTIHVVLKHFFKIVQ